MKTIFKFFPLISIFYFTFALAQEPSNVDPYEKFNRGVFIFNHGLDVVILRPIAVVYKTIIPSPIRTGVTHFFNNLQILDTIANDILQLKLKYTIADTMRFILNSSFGVGGLFDVSTPLGFEPHYEDLGLTFAYWSNGRPSPYLVFPILGPLTIRDGIGLIGDYFTQPWPYIRPSWISYAAFGLRTIDIRSRLLEVDPIINQSFDPYIFVRSAYLQTRQNLIEKNKLPYRSHFEREEVSGAIAEPPPASSDELSSAGPKEHALASGPIAASEPSH